MSAALDSTVSRMAWWKKNFISRGL